jgi:NADPH-dependent ferric siderophore reductase
VSTRLHQFAARVQAREQLSDHLIRLRLQAADQGAAAVDWFPSTGIPDEWVGLTVPGQFQSRYYTVRRYDGRELVLDVVVHEVGLVTEWASRDCVGEVVTITEPRGSFAPPPEATWLILVGDLTAVPAMARIAEHTALPTKVWAEVPDDLGGYLPASAETIWVSTDADGSRLAQIVETIQWPEGPGYFWMAGESAQMRAIRKYLLRERHGSAYDVMGYWRIAAARQPRAVDPGPIWRAGKAAGRTDDEIWAAYDRARDLSTGELDIGETS